MIEKFKINLSSIIEKNRFSLWLVLLVLTAVILLFPLSIVYEYHSIESISAFGDNLPIFITTFYIWAAILLLLLFSRGTRNDWQRIALLCLFTVVFLDIWIINTPYGDHWDVLWQLGHIRYILDTGSINPAVLDYFAFPGFHLLNSSLSQICGLGVLETKTLYLIFSDIMLVTLLYLMFTRWLHNPRLGSLAAILMIMGWSIGGIQSFTPGNLASVFLIILLFLLTPQEEGETEKTGGTIQQYIVLLILLFAFITTYLPTPAALLFILAGVFLMQMLAKKSVVSWLVIAGYVAMFLLWELCWSFSWAKNLTDSVYSGLVEGLRDPLSKLPWILKPVQGYITGAAPLWTRLTKYFGLAIIMFGSILGGLNIFRIRKLSSREVIITGGLVGIGVFTVFCILTFTWESQWTRFLKIAPLFTIPIMIKFFTGLRIGSIFRRYSFPLVVVLVLIFSLPTFLIQRPPLFEWANYSYECSAFEFLESTYKGENVAVYSTSNTVIGCRGYISAYYFSSTDPGSSSINREELWEEMNDLVDDFEDFRVSDAVFILSERFRLPPLHPAAIQSDDPRWIEFVDKLTDNDIIYSNGHIEIYSY